MAAISSTPTASGEGASNIQSDLFLTAVLRLQEGQRIVPITREGKEAFEIQTTNGCMRQLIAVLRRVFFRPFGKDSIYNQMVQCLKNLVSNADLDSGLIKKIRDYACKIGLAKEADQLISSNVVTRLHQLTQQQQLPSIDTTLLRITLKAKRKVPIDMLMPGTQITFRQALEQATRDALDHPEKSLNDVLKPILQILRIEIDNVVRAKLTDLTRYSPMFTQYLIANCLDVQDGESEATLYQNLLDLLAKPDEMFSAKVKRILWKQYWDYLNRSQVRDLTEHFEIQHVEKDAEKTSEVQKRRTDAVMQNLMQDQDLSVLVGKCQKHFGKEAVDNMLWETITVGEAEMQASTRVPTSTLTGLMSGSFMHDKMRDLIGRLQQKQQEQVAGMLGFMRSNISTPSKRKVLNEEEQVGLRANLLRTDYNTPEQFMRGCVASGYFDEAVLRDVITRVACDNWLRALLRKDSNEQQFREWLIDLLITLQKGRDEQAALSSQRQVQVEPAAAAPSAAVPQSFEHVAPAGAGSWFNKPVPKESGCSIM